MLAKNGVETEVVYPAMLRHAAARSAATSPRVAAAREECRRPRSGLWIDKGYDVVALVPSCALMLKFEWPLILPNDAAVEKLAAATYDISEYIVDIAKKRRAGAGA